MNRSANLTSLSACVMLFFSLLLVTGCGGPTRATVQGTVTLDSKNVDGGRIMFIATDKNGANAHADIQDGKYSLEAINGPSVGTHRVEIVWYKKTGKQIVGSDPPAKVDEKIQVVPKQYNAKSAVKEEIKPGANMFNYDLKSDPQSEGKPDVKTKKKGS